MVTNKRTFGKATSMPVGIGIGVLISLVIVIIGCAVLALMVDREIMETEAVGYGAMVVLLLASFLGVVISIGLVKRRILLVSIIQMTVLLCVLLLINGVLFGGSVNGLLPTALLLLGGTGCAVLLKSQNFEWKRSKAKRWRTG